LPHSKNLRNWAGLKVFIVAGVWAASTVLLPALETKGVLNWDVWVENLQRFVFVLVLILPFEIRDMAYDAPELKTLPQRLGTGRTKVLGVFMAWLFILLTFAKDELTVFLLVTHGVIFLLLLWLLWLTREKQYTYFASFVVESVPIFWWVLALLFLT
jgi:hypothetical protein